MRMIMLATWSVKKGYVQTYNNVILCIHFIFILIFKRKACPVKGGGTSEK